MRRMMILGCALVGALAGSAVAEVQIYDAAEGWVRTRRVDPSHSGAYLIERSVAVPAATVDRALSQQPVQPWMYEVRVGRQVTKLDSLADYNSDGPGRLDEQHWILRSQREFLARNTYSGAYVISGSRQQPMVRRFEPLMTIERPDGGRKPGKPNAPGLIPNAPAPATRKPQVASAN